MRKIGMAAAFLLFFEAAELRAQVTSDGTINARAVSRFVQSLSRTNALRVGVFGDSVTDPSGGGKFEGFSTNLIRAFGRSGGLMVNFPWLRYTVDNETRYLVDTNWFWYHAVLTNRSSITFQSDLPTGPKVYCDSAAIYFLHQPGAGAFEIQIATNGGFFGRVATVDCDGEYGSAVTNFSLELGWYQMKCVNISSTNTILDGGMWIERSKNLAPILGLTAPGRAYTDWTALSTNVTWPIWRFLKPDLILMEAKDDAPTFSSAFPSLEKMFTNCSPEMDVIYIATTPSAGGDENYAIPQNAVMRQMAINYSRFYWDGYSVFASYSQATGLGYTQDDGTHFNRAGGGTWVGSCGPNSGTLHWKFRLSEINLVWGRWSNGFPIATCCINFSMLHRSPLRIG